MKKKFLFIGCVSALVITAGCGSNDNEKSTTSTTEQPAAKPQSAESKAASDSTKGMGKFTNVQLTHPLDQGLVTKGKAIYDVKCMSCHKLTSEKLVGPGWKDVTKRRKPEWIMNFVTNTDEMIDKDPHAQAMLEECMVRMPNQNLSDDEARQVLEFMRNNDGDK